MNSTFRRIGAALTAVCMIFVVLTGSAKVAHADNVSVATVAAQTAIQLPDSLPSAATETTHCKVTERWSVAMKFKLSKKITLTFWAAVLSKNLIAYCYLAQRMTVAKNTYIKIAINGVGPYKAGKSVTRLVRLSHMCVKAYVQLFKMDDKGVHTYWRKAPTESQCG